MAGYLMRNEIARLLYSNLPKPLVALGFNRLSAVCIARAATRHLDFVTNGRNSLLISGLARTGKTILASRLVSKYNYNAMMADMVQPYFFSISDCHARMRLRKDVYSEILNQYGGLIIEGDDFILENTGGVAKINHKVDISLAIYLSKKFNIKVFLLGNADVSVDEKLAGIRLFSAKEWCWTTAVDPDEAREYTSWLIRVSQRLRDLADGKNMYYFELDPNNFEKSVDRVAEKVASLSG